MKFERNKDRDCMTFLTQMCPGMVEDVPRACSPWVTSMPWVMCPYVYPSPPALGIFCSSCLSWKYDPFNVTDSVENHGKRKSKNEAYHTKFSTTWIHAQHLQIFTFLPHVNDSSSLLLSMSLLFAMISFSSISKNNPCTRLALNTTWTMQWFFS